MTAQQKESILSRIKKLQSLTVERGATPEEAANAAAKAQALLFEHNLSQAQVDMTNKEQKEQIKDNTYNHQATRFDIRWKRSLLHSIAVNNFCETVYTFGETTQQIIGKPSNVEVVIYLYESITRQIEAMADEAAKKQLSNKGVYKRSFCMGAVQTVRVRLRAQRKTDEQTTAQQSQSNALMIINVGKELEAAKKKFYPKLRTVRGAAASNIMAYTQGLAAGGRVSINRGVGGGGGKKQIG